MTDDKIKGALTDLNIPIYNREETMNRISPNGILIFTILVLLNFQDDLLKFIESDQLNDAKLPFSAADLIQGVSLSEESAREFEEKQWELIAPVFSYGRLNRRFRGNVVLPFTSSKEIGRGAFGTVYEVIIDKNHQAPTGDFPEKIARKVLHMERDHQKELKNLSILNHIKHPNIVELLGSFIHHGEYNLLFPLASGGNLKDFLNTERARHTQFRGDKSLPTALAALASAVKHVHSAFKRTPNLKLIGCHHDLRPRNILVSGDRFILADFGLSTLKPTSQGSQTSFKNVSDDYLAPECEDWNDNFQGGTVHRSADIWSLGCIIAEVATYMALGPEGVNQFREKRAHKIRGWTLHQFHQGPGQPSEAVERWLSSLEKSSSRTITLLVQTARRALCINYLGRPSATDITERLQFISIHEAATTLDVMFHQIKQSRPDIFGCHEMAQFTALREVNLLYDTERERLLSSPNYTNVPMTRYEILRDINQNLDVFTPCQPLESLNLYISILRNEKVYGFLCQG